MLCFEVGKLFTERRLVLCNLSAARLKFKLFGQGNDCKQVTYFNAGNTGSKPRSRSWVTPRVSSCHLHVKRRMVMGFEPGQF